MEKKVAKRKKYDSIEQEAYLSLWRTYDRLKGIEEQLFDQWKITPQQYNVLRLLHASHPLPIATLALSNRLISKAPDITRMLDKLETSGFIGRTRSSEDRRAVLVNITSIGQRLVRDIAKPLADSHQQQLGHMSHHDLHTLCELLQLARDPHETDL
jgi:DNA-binding MarR family transcriptional regulator